VKNERECRVGGLRGDKKQESAHCFGSIHTLGAPPRIGANFAPEAPLCVGANFALGASLRVGANLTPKGPPDIGIFFTPEAPLRIGANFTFKAPSPHTLEASAEPRSVDEGDVLSKDDEELEEASEQSEHGANED